MFFLYKYSKSNVSFSGQAMGSVSACILLIIRCFWIKKLFALQGFGKRNVVSLFIITKLMIYYTLDICFAVV